MPTQACPACDRGDSGVQHFFVNGRWVRDRLLTQALQDAYRGLLMTGRHAVAFLYLDLPPEDVDVNVHPTKAEVRFRDQEGLQQLISEAVRQRLQAEDLTGRLRGPARSPKTPPPAPEPVLDFPPPPEPVASTATAPRPEPPPTPPAKDQGRGAPVPSSPASRPAVTPPAAHRGTDKQPALARQRQPGSAVAVPTPPEAAATAKAAGPPGQEASTPGPPPAVRAFLNCSPRSCSRHGSGSTRRRVVRKGSRYGSSLGARLSQSSSASTSRVRIAAPVIRSAASSGPWDSRSMP